MKLPQRILQFGTLALFSSMIGSLVLYRGGSFESSSSLPPWFSQTQQDSLQPPWYDTVQFKQILRKKFQGLPETDIRMFGSKSAPPAPPQKKGKRKSAEMSEAALKHYATHVDTLEIWDILRTRYEVAHLSKQEAREFKRIFSAIKKERQSTIIYLPFESDSSRALSKLRYGPQILHQLSDLEKTRFNILMDSLKRPRMMSSKTGLIFISAADTTRVIKMVKSEKQQ